jgi:hypothetical protein
MRLILGICTYLFKRCFLVGGELKLAVILHKLMRNYKGS